MTFRSSSGAMPHYDRVDQLMGKISKMWFRKKYGAKKKNNEEKIHRLQSSSRLENGVNDYSMFTQTDTD